MHAHVCVSRCDATASGQPTKRKHNAEAGARTSRSEKNMCICFKVRMWCVRQCAKHNRHRSRRTRSTTQHWCDNNARSAVVAISKCRKHKEEMCVCCVFLAQKRRLDPTCGCASLSHSYYASNQGMAVSWLSKFVHLFGTSMARCSESGKIQCVLMPRK